MRECACGVARAKELRRAPRGPDLLLGSRETAKLLPFRHLSCKRELQRAARLEMMLAELKLLANKRDVPYQSLIKIFLAERLEEELKTQKN